MLFAGTYGKNFEVESYFRDLLTEMMQESAIITGVCGGDCFMEITKRGTTFKQSLLIHSIRACSITAM